LLRSKVNPEIEKQLESEEKRKNFWFLNNGLTIVCRKIEENENEKKIKLFGAQIVNGCQTAYTISKHPKSLDCVFVIAKIIQTSDPQFAYDVRRGTNLQNAITPRDLHSGDFIQLKLQREFERLGYYYERKKDEWNVWKKNTPGIVTRYPKGNIDNEEVAQYFLAFEEKPSEAKEEKRKIFESSGFYPLIFKPTRTANELLLPFLIRNYIYKNFDIGKRTRGVRKTIKHFVKTIGDFTILALLGKILKKKYKLNTVKIELLVERFENPNDHRDFFHPFDEIVKNLVSKLINYAKKVRREYKSRGEEWDPRELHRRYNDLVRDTEIRKLIKEGVKKLPPL